MSGISNRVEWVAGFVNKAAEAITDDDIARAASRLGVTSAHIRMVRAVESGGRSFDIAGRPVILFEPHIFYRQTRGKYGTTSFSYQRWGQKPYPKGFDARWHQMADAAERDEESALASASWGLFQVMGFNAVWLGYASAREMACSLVESEAAHLEVMLRYVERKGIAGDLAACRAGVPDSCRAFAKGYNGAGYAGNEYHIKMARALK